MNESTVSSPLMKRIAENLPGSVCVKTHDVSTTGLPDYSVTYRGREFKLEFKLWVPLKSWDGRPCTVPVHEIALKGDHGPLQFAMMQRYAIAASMSVYIVWVKKSKCVVLWDPRHTAGTVVSTATTRDMADLISSRIERLTQ